jgi:hypothetical protein
MTMNIHEQIWSNFGRDHLVKWTLEQDAKIYANNRNRFLDSNTSAPERLSKTEHTRKILP